jgi:hypothetical protein
MHYLLQNQLHHHHRQTYYYFDYNPHHHYLAPVYLFHKNLKYLNLHQLLILRFLLLLHRYQKYLLLKQLN